MIGETEVQQIYAATAKWHSSLPDQARQGYAILNGPLRHQPPIFFIGLNFGGEGHDAEVKTWPDRFELYYDTDLLAKHVQSIFHNGGMELLSECTGTNVNFLATRNSDILKQRLSGGYKDAECYCMSQVKKLIKIINPKMLFVIGLTTLRKLQHTFAVSEAVSVCECGPLNQYKSHLWKIGRLDDRPFISTVHLSGRQKLTREDRLLIKDRVREFVGI